MAILKLSAALSLLLCASAATAVYAQLDGFELPPGIENTRIPKRVHYNPRLTDGPAEQAQPDPEPFALKEYKLGMSLDDFTHAPPPVASDGSKVKSVCSCEPGQTIETVNEEDAKAKVVTCGFWTTAPTGGNVTAPYRMTVGGLPCSPDFRFIEDNGAYRLFEIGISFYSSNYEDMRKALVQKYGNPTSKTTQKIKLDTGNIFPATYLNWDNGVSRIRLANVDGTNIGRAKLRYLHQRLVLAYASRINQYRSTPVQRASDDL